MTRRAVPALLAAVLLLPLVSGARDEPWRWTASDLEEISRLEHKVKTKKTDSTLLSTRDWRVQTWAGARFTAEVALFMERFHELFSRFVPGREAITVKPTVVVYPTQEKYLEKVDRPGSRGLFRYRFSGSGSLIEYHLYTFTEDGDNDFARFYRPVLLHEGTHALLQKYLGPLESPPWFTEGLAEYLEAFDLRLSLIDNRALARDELVRKLRLVPDADTPMPLPELLALSYRHDNTWSPDRGGARTRRNYAAAGAWTDFLLSSEQNERVLVTVFGRLAQGVSPARVLTPEEIRAIEPAWFEHWRMLREAARGYAVRRTDPASGAGGGATTTTEAGCDTAESVVASTVGASVERSSGTFNHEAFREPVRGCRVVIRGSFENVLPGHDAGSHLREAFTAERWQEMLAYAADGEDGSAFAFRRGEAACLVRDVWGGLTYEVTVLCTSPPPPEERVR